MTIRHYIKRRSRNLAVIFVALYATVQVLSLCVQHWPDTFANPQWRYAVTLANPRAALVLIGWWVVRTLVIPCPRCSRPLGGAVPAVWFGQKINRCPNCRVSLDEPMESPANPK